MSHRILVFYGSYRSDRMGIRLAQFVVDGLRGRGDDVELIDAKAIGLPSTVKLCEIGPTAIVLEITTMPISDSVPCQAVAARAPEMRPAE